MDRSGTHLSIGGGSPQAARVTSAQSGSHPSRMRRLRLLDSVVRRTTDQPGEQGRALRGRGRIGTEGRHPAGGDLDQDLRELQLNVVVAGQIVAVLGNASRPVTEVAAALDDGKNLAREARRRAGAGVRLV